MGKLQSTEATQREHTGTTSSKVDMKIIALVISLACLVHGEGLFLSTALDGVEIKLRGRDRGPDITQVEVHIRPKEVTASGDIPSLEYKEEDGCWKQAPAKAGPTNRGQKKRWRLDLPAPCKTYKFRLALHSDSCIDYLEHPTTMGGSPLYLVNQTRFIPGAPENLQMSGDNSLEWDAVPCASEYQVTYSTEDGKTTTRVGEDALSNTQLPFPSSPCQTVDAVVKAVSGLRKGPGARITFNTCQAEEDRDNTTLDASFLFADFQEEECPTQNLPLCKASPLPSPLVTLGLKDSLDEEKQGVVVKELSQFPTLLICLVAGGLLLFLILAIVFTIVIRRRQRSGIHHVQKS